MASIASMASTASNISITNKKVDFNYMSNIYKKNKLTSLIYQRNNFGKLIFFADVKDSKIKKRFRKALDLIFANPKEIIWGGSGTNFLEEFDSDDNYHTIFFFYPEEKEVLRAGINYSSYFKNNMNKEDFVNIITQKISTLKSGFGDYITKLCFFILNDKVKVFSMEKQLEIENEALIYYEKEISDTFNDYLNYQKSQAIKLKTKKI